MLHSDLPLFRRAVWQGKALAIVSLLLLAACDGSSGEPTNFDPVDAWATHEGFAVEVDAHGFTLPTAIAFVPQPGADPGDPLYFVAELRGTIKVVTNDRQVLTFAEVETVRPDEELPEREAETGLAGLCLAPEEGYVFVTFTELDEIGIIRNRILRFEGTPQTLGHSPTGVTEIAPEVGAEPSSFSHQIGNCWVAGDALYVGVGEGFNPAAARTPERLLGKVLRLTLDGRAHPDNPFAGDSPGNEQFVWATGFRNPFGIEVVDDKVFVADNGPEVDRFTQVRRGGDYLWDGSQWSFASAADAVFAPGIAPVNLRRYPSGSELFPEEFRDAFFLATSGGPAGIVILPYDVGAAVATGGPRHFVERRFEGPVNVGLGGLAFGPDGLYFTSILPNPDGDSPILKVVHRPTPEFPHIIGRTGGVIESRGCLACHVIAGEGGQVGPELNFESAGRRNEVLQRLESDSYAALQQQLDALTDPYYLSTREAREEVRDASGDDKVRVYIQNKVLEPSFDRLNSAMPQLGLTEEEAKVIANTLLGPSDGGLGAVINRVALRMRDLLPVPSDQRAGDMTAGAYAGFLGGVLVTVAAMLFIRYLGPRVWARRPAWLRRR